jgi:hypothetical protein
VSSKEGRKRNLPESKNGRAKHSLVLVGRSIRYSRRRGCMDLEKADEPLQTVTISNMVFQMLEN